MKSIEERVKLCIGKHPDWTDRQVSKSLGLLLGAVEEIRNRGAVAPGETVYEGHPKADAPQVGLVSLDRIRERYDIKAAILREVGKLGKGKLISENELAERAAGKDRNRFRRAVENGADELGPMRIKLRLDDSSEGKWYWGRAADIAEATRIRDL